MAVYISATSYHLPDKICTNREIIDEYKRYTPSENQENISEEEITLRSGIEQRYVSMAGESAKDLGVKAAEKLFTEWQIDRNEIDYLIFVSDALDYKGPTTACIIQHNLNLQENCAAIDILHGCTGFIYGLSLAKSLIEAQGFKNVLLITADVPTKIIHPSDIDLRAIFSDAGAATLISKEKTTGRLNWDIQNFVFGTDGKGEKNLYVERSGTRNPADINWLEQHQHLPTKLTGGRLLMNSKQIFLFALRKVPILIANVLEKNNLNQEEINYFVLHQANGVMLEFIRKKMNIPETNYFVNIKEKGNTVAASIPIALRDMITQGKLKDKKNNNLFLGGFGIGYSWGGCIVRIGEC